MQARHRHSSRLTGRSVTPGSAGQPEFPPVIERPPVFVKPALAAATIALLAFAGCSSPAPSAG
ncbi:MAG: hypothetical protein KDB51_09025, partial [Propionibacteriaceae bacterium]|nr:hypothetical protein [Propionibacteriaceae bacterium]